MKGAANSEDRHSTGGWRSQTSTEEMLLELHFVDRINLSKSQKMYYNWLESFMQQSELRKQKLFCNFIQGWCIIKYQVTRKAELKKTYCKLKGCLQNNHMPSFIAQRTFHTWWSGAFQVSVDITIQSQWKTCFLIWKLYLKYTTKKHLISMGVQKVKV